MKLLENPVFIEARDYIREGISFRLNSYEDTTSDMVFTINTKPRDCYMLPDIVLADLDHEQQPKGKNPLTNAL